MNPRPRILIFYDYFTPAYKAGGPIQSITNLVRYLAADLAFFIFTTNQDHDGTVLETDPDRWLDFEGCAKVYYASPGERKYQSIKKTIAYLEPHYIYINGMFSPLCVLYPLWASRRLNIKTIIAPRGMLHPGALKLKKRKKNLFLRVCKMLFLRTEIFWHATDHEEAEHIQTLAPTNNVQVVGNIPKVPPRELAARPNIDQEVKIVSVCLIARKKNILQTLRVLQQMHPEKKVIYNIYGSIKEKDYFKELQEQLKADHKNQIEIQYKGSLHPHEVFDTLQKYHFFVLPTFGENFGHALYEAFACGLPVITSDQTPWRNLKAQKAGWDVDISENENLKMAIEEAIAMNNEMYRTWSKSARYYAQNYLATADLKHKYLKLFSGI